MLQTEAGGTSTPIVSAGQTAHQEKVRHLLLGSEAALHRINPLPNLPMATTSDDVWRILGELAEAQKETERRLQETEQLLKEQAQETDRQIRRVNRQIGDLGNRLGKFIEWQVRPAAARFSLRFSVAVGHLWLQPYPPRPPGGTPLVK